jgi:gliding motility-associated-like protein
MKKAFLNLLGYKSRNQLSILDFTYNLKPQILRQLLLSLCIYWFNNDAIAQSPSFEWSRRWIYETQGTDVDVDSEGNVYLISYGNQTTNFNPNPGNIPGPTFGCAAVTKLDPNGNTIWIKFIEQIGASSGGITPSNISVKNGSIYVAGVFGGGGGVYDFDPGFGSATSTGLNPTLKGFVFKWDLNGNYNWHKTITTAQAIFIEDMHLDSNENIFLCGSFNQTLNSGSFSTNSNGGGDCFFIKLDSLGNTLLMKSFGGVSNSTDEALGICSNSMGEIYLTGKFELSVDFDPGAGQTILNSFGSDDVFVSKFDSQGDFVWAHSFGSTNAGDEGRDIILDENENIVFTGSINGNIDFDPSNEVNTLYSLINYAYIAKWNPNGEFIWAQGIYSDQTAQGWQLSMQNSTIGLVGICKGTVDFDPSNNDVLINTTGGIYNTFILNLTDSGQYLWAGILQNINGYLNRPEGIVISNNSILICGWFEGTMNSNPISNQSNTLNSLTNTSGVPKPSNYIIKLGKCFTTAPTQNINSCSPYTWDVNNQTYTESGIYTETLISTNGCDSIVSLNLSFNVPEICDGIDSDCDGVIDNGFDLDGDGATTCNGDCDDNNSLVNPAAVEISDTIDNNCNGEIDEGINPDNDGDGFSEADGDCDDTNANINPDAIELCNGIDDNCNTQVDEGFDIDGDTFTICDGDCDDTNSTINPDAIEMCNDIDDNCDTQIDEGFDLDADNFTICNGDCDDGNNAVYPGAIEILDTIDNNCDGQIDEDLDSDEDGDGFTPTDGDCDDANAAINPNATELCNGIDDNCNLQVDEGFDVDGDGFTTCNGDCNDNNNAVYPGAVDIDDNVDNDCDGQIDENADSDGDDYTPEEGDCNDSNPNIYPGAPEICNELDDDCDSLIDEELDCEEVFVIPNGISPNGDGINDAWYLPWLNNMSNYSIVISNRWGQVMFQTTDYSAPWEGIYLGNPLPSADYFYLIKLSDNTSYEGVISIKY